MQYDMERFEQPLVDETQPKAHVWTDIGDAEVEHSIFGKAKVRVYRKQDEVRGAVGWVLVSMSLVVGAVWLANDASRQPEIVYAAPPKPAVEVAPPETQKPVRVAPPVKVQAAPAIAARQPASQQPAASAPVAARPLPRAPAVVSGESAPVAVLVKPPAPAATPSEMLRPPVDVASAVRVTN